MYTSPLCFRKPNSPPPFLIVPTHRELADSLTCVLETRSKAATQKTPLEHHVLTRHSHSTPKSPCPGRDGWGSERTGASKWGRLRRDNTDINKTEYCAVWKPISAEILRGNVILLPPVRSHYNSYSKCALTHFRVTKVNTALWCAALYPSLPEICISFPSSWSI